MKKIYVLAVVCLCFGITGIAQNNFYWIGPASPTAGDWNNGANWSETQGGPTKNAFPNSTAANVFFPVSAVVNLNGSVDVNRITVTGGVSTAVLVKATGGFIRIITANSTNPALPGLSIASGSRFEQGADANSDFNFKFVPGGQAAINGEWYLNGDIDNSSLTYFELPNSVTPLPLELTTLISVNTGGAISIGAKGYTPLIDPVSENYLAFNAGATLKLMTDAPIIPPANYAASSIIQLTGVISQSVSFEELESVGNITYNCPLQSNGSIPVSLNLTDIDVKGNLTVQNTNNQELVLLQYIITPGVPMEATILGNLDIQGNSKVAMSYVDATEVPSDLYVKGNVIVNGTEFSLQSQDMSTEASTLHVGGNIQHTAGLFGAATTSGSPTVAVYVVEMDGSTPQTIFSHNGMIDNIVSEVTLRINNSNGVTLLSPLSVGKVDFNTVSSGILHGNGNVFTINNTSGLSPIVVILPTNKDLGFVDGVVRRNFESDQPLVMPTGSGSSGRNVTIIPEGSNLSTYEAQYFNTPHASTNFNAPIAGIAPYYWIINRISGENAVVQMNFSSAIAGATSADVLFAGKFNGTSWTDVKGNTITPANVTSGTITSVLQTSFSPFSIVYTSQAALPTLLTSFNGKKISEKSIQLNWKITDNSTPASFEVLHSDDGVNFIKAGTVTGFEGRLNYEFAHNSIIAGNNYYRLKMYDKDGTITYSTIIIITNGTRGVTITSMMPTVVRDRAKLTVSSSLKGNIQLVVTDINGRIIQNQTASVIAGNQEIWLNATRLAAGMFQITGYINGEKTTTIRFIKQ